MYFFSVVICFVIFIQLYRAVSITETQGNCKLIDLDDDDAWNRELKLPAIKDTQTGTFYEGKCTNITDGHYCKKYICIDIKNNEFIIGVNDDFPQIDGDIQYMGNTQAQMTPSIELLCANNVNRSLPLRIPVDDTNNHDPVFGEKIYTYNLPMPMSPKINISSFGKVITVKDIDFSNTFITLSSDFEDVSCIGGKGLKGNFSYELDLQFIGIEKMTQTKTFTLTAQDSGSPPRYATAKVTINIDHSNSEPPAFTKSSYLFDYDAATGDLKSRDGDTALVTYWDDVKCEVQNFKDFFDATLNKEQITLKVKKPLDDVMTNGMATVTIACYVVEKTGKIQADAIIFMKSTSDTATFNTKIYTATYVDDKTPTIKMDDKISITKGKPENYEIKFDDSLKTYFKIEPTDGSWTMKSISPLSINYLKKVELNMIIKLWDKIQMKEIDEAFITLLLPTGVNGVAFTKSFFIGDYEYDQNGTGKMQDIDIELNNNYYDNAKCQLENSDYSGFFEISCNGNNFPILKKKDNIDKKLLKNNEKITLSMSMDIICQGELERNIKTAILINLKDNGQQTTTTTTTTHSTKTTDSPTTHASTKDSTTDPSTTHSTTETPKNDDCSHTGWIVTTIVIFILLVIYVIVSVTYYFKRIRNRTETDMNISIRSNHFEPRGEKRTSEKFKNVSTRRPTGFIRYNPDLDKDSINSDYGDAQEEVNNNTNANRFLNASDEAYKEPNVGRNDRRNIGFDIPSPPPESPL